MRKKLVFRCMAALLTLMLAISGLAAAEEDAVFAELTEAPVTDAGEAELVPSEDEFVEESEENTVGEIVEAPAEEAVGEPVEASVEAPAAEDAETLAGAPVEEDAETPAEVPDETSAEEVGQRCEALVEETWDKMGEESGELSELPEVAEVAEADAAAAYKSMEAGGAPTAIAIDTSLGSDFWLGMGPSQLNVLMEPADAQTTLKWSSSKKKVAKVDANGIITPRKAGSTKITVKTRNKKKSTLKINIHRNLVNNIYPKPTKSDITALNGGWAFWPKSVERTAAGNYVAKIYLLNGAGKSKQITDFGIQLSVGDIVVAQKYLSKIKVVCNKGKSKVFKVIFSGADLLVADPMLLPQYGADNIHLTLLTEPGLVYKKKVVKNKATVQTTSQSSSENTYILNTNSMKFHYSNCGIADRISSENRSTYTGNRADLMAKGYSPCGNCNP